MAHASSRKTTGAQKVDFAGVAPAAATATPLFSAPGLTDPEAAGQWHLGRLGGISSVWAEFTGKGVHVGVYDSGVQYAHYDLKANYDASRHVVVDGRTYDGDHRPLSGPHGTSVAGIIAAARNGVGTVGIAYDAKITGVNIFDPYSGGGRDPGIFVNAGGSAFFEAMRQASRFDVVNHSWGSSETSFETANSRTNSGTFSYGQAEVLRYVAEVGRGGLGTVSVLASGNNNTDAQGDPWNSDRHAISVAAYRQSDSYASSYSSRGAHLLVSAPSSDNFSIGGSGFTATDLLGRNGYNLRSDLGGAHDYTDMFGGTSAAAPVVTGVVALMLDANEGLGWRDVKNILAASAFAPRGVAAPPGGVEQELYTIRLNESRFKLAGRDADWNGGAMHYSTDYGYGGVDARAAVRMAEVWSLFDTAQTSANERSIGTGELAVNLSSRNWIDRDFEKYHTDFVGTPAKFTFEVKDPLNLEHVDLTVRMSTGLDTGTEFYPYGVDGLQLKLTAPDGTQGFVDTANANAEVGNAEHVFTFGFSGFRGVSAAGTWTFEFLEPYYDIRTTVKSIKLDAWGSAIDANDVYTYTDEFFDMVASERGVARKALADVDGGTDWINAAAVTHDVVLSLLERRTATFDGRAAFQIRSGTLIENAITGDGDDRLSGNALDNKLYGMRGDDWLNGGAGNDRLFGGRGRDTFAFDTAGVSGNDVILDWSAGDLIATSKKLRGTDTNGFITLGSNAVLLLDGTASQDTVQLAEQGGAVLTSMGRTGGYWWYGFVTSGNDDITDGVVREAALPDAFIAELGFTAPSIVDAAATTASPVGDMAFFLYDTMGDAMAAGVQTSA